jgi:hypothetical protein
MTCMTTKDTAITLVGEQADDPAMIDMCKIETRLATSGRTRAYRAVDLSLGKTVVVKTLGSDYDHDAHAEQRFLAFGQAMVGLQSPHVVPVLRAGRSGPVVFLVLDYVDGEDLDHLLKRDRRMVPQAALAAVLDAAAGLAAALAVGVLHGDVRPRHLLRVRGQVRVTSFGLSPAHKTAQGRELTGHPAYVAPEVIERKAADHRADMYSLGCTLFELVAGRPPYGSGHADALLACHVHEPFPSLRALVPRIPVELEAFVQSLTHKRPEQRPASYQQLLQQGAGLLPLLRSLPLERPVLVVEDGRQVGMRVELAEGDTVLGRYPDDGVAIDDGRVSRRHAMVRCNGEHIEVEDLNSRNGVRVNGVAVKHRQLFSGDRLEVGDTLLRLDANTTLTAASQQGRALASPLRAAFGDDELMHPPAQQARPDVLGETVEGEPSSRSQHRLLLLSRLAPLLASRTGVDDTLLDQALSIVSDVVRADHRIVLRVQDQQPVLRANTSHEAQLLSGALPAIERALPGQLSLSTTVRINTDDRWAVMLAPVRSKEQTMAMLILVKRVGRFDAAELQLLEASCALLSLRHAL